MARVRLPTLAVLLCAACSPASPVPIPDGGTGGAPVTCAAGFLGDRTKPPELEIIAIGGDGGVSPVEDGGTVGLIFPPQGGRVIFAGARATNLDGCGVQITGALRDEATQQVQVDSRTVNLVPAGDGWGESNPDDVPSFSNVPACPNEWSKTNIYGTRYQLQLTVADPSGRTATSTLEVTPECAEPTRAAECMCICMGGYILGQSCADAGAGDAGDGGDGGGGDGGDGGG